MKLRDKIFLTTITILNIFAFAGMQASAPEVKTAIKEVPQIVQQANDKAEVITSKKKVSKKGETCVEYSDGSWEIYNGRENKYIFQPACMGDWFYELDSMEQLRNCRDTYFEGKIVKYPEPEKQSKLNEQLNPEKIQALEDELNILPDRVKQKLINEGVQIYIQKDWSKSQGKNTVVWGTYFWDTNAITLDDDNYSIHVATIHEVGHALDDFYGISKNEKIIESFNNKEIHYDNPHMYENVKEYVAESIQDYYKGKLNKNTVMYHTLDNILNNLYL